jgi:putative transposase
MHFENKENTMGNPDYNPENHHRHSIRLSNYNYATRGAYFVTLCTKPRQPLFDRPELRAILEENWYALPQRFQGLQLDEFVIMPDHIHFIVWLDSAISGGITLGDIIKAYKSLTFKAWLKYIETNHLHEQAKFWQRNYMERIIRTNNDLIEKRAYICNNPLRTEMKRQPSP